MTLQATSISARTITRAGVSLEFEGTNCGTDIDECAEVPCMNRATCVESSTDSSRLLQGVHMFVYTGFRWRLVRKNFDECHSIPVGTTACVLTGSMDIPAPVLSFTEA